MRAAAGGKEDVRRRVSASGDDSIALEPSRVIRWTVPGGHSTLTRRSSKVREVPSKRASLAPIGAILLFAGCVLTDEHAADRTRREQELLAIAVGRAVNALDTKRLEGEPLRLDVAALARDVAPYIRSTLRLALLSRGIDAVVETDEHGPDLELHFLVDVAASESSRKSIELPLPIPFATGRIGFPLYERRTQAARVRFSAYLLERSSNVLLETYPTMTGGAHVRETTYLSYFGPYRDSDVDELQEEPVEVEE